MSNFSIVLGVRPCKLSILLAILLTLYQVCMESVPLFRELIAIVANTVSNNKPGLLEATKAIVIIAAAQRIACVMTICSMTTPTLLFVMSSYIIKVS